ncbi:MAG: TrkH family potassium uptake protein [Clostridia bacterium]|nr:TrkH family potassium uptake protein [Clostridia bacterium]
MNRRMIAYTIGRILIAEAALMLPSVLVGLIYREPDTWVFAPAVGLLVLAGVLLGRKKPENTVIYARDGYFIVAAVWILLSLFGAIPFRLCGRMGRFWDCFFEIASGFSTTGASIVTDIDVLPKCIIFWRSFSHWIGGMGVLMFVLAIMPLSEERSLHLMRAEVPGPVVGKLVPRIRDTAKILYGVYAGLTAILAALLMFGKMPLFDALCYAFGTAGTGGFSISNAGIVGYNSAYIETVIAVFMLLFGVNFNLYYFILIGKAKDAFKSEELHVYLGVIAFAVAAISINVYHVYGSVWQTLRYTFFQVTTIISTSGFATADFANNWPLFSQMILVFLMFTGACAGSTGGGLKMSRIMVLFKTCGQEIHHLIHPRAVTVVRLEHKPVNHGMIRATLSFFTFYIAILAASTLLLSLDNGDFTTNFTASLACLSNIGPGLGKVGPIGNYAFYSGASKVMLALEMLAGRLELFPIIVLFGMVGHRSRNGN